MTHPQLIRAAIDASGLPAQRFARAILARDDRTIRRWLAGDPIPATARTWLVRWLALDPATRDQIVRALTATATA